MIGLKGYIVSGRIFPSEIDSREFLLNPYHKDYPKKKLKNLISLTLTTT